MPVLLTRAARRCATITAVIVTVMTGLVGCATDDAGTPVGGVQAPAPPPLQGVARALGVATTDPEPQEFVRNSRPATAPDYIPVGITPPPRAAPKRDASALEKLEQELDGQRGRSRAYAARPKPASPYDGKIPPRPKAQPAVPAE